MSTAQNILGLDGQYYTVKTSNPGSALPQPWSLRTWAEDYLALARERIARYEPMPLTYTPMGKQYVADMRESIDSKLNALPDGSLDLSGYFTSAPHNAFGREFEMAAEVGQIQIFGVRIPTRKLTPEFVMQLARGAQMTSEGAAAWQAMLFGEAEATNVARVRDMKYDEQTNTEGESVNNEVAVYEPTSDEMLAAEVAERRKAKADAERDAEYAAKLALYESYGADREDGAVVTFSKQFETDPTRVYTYASLRANGKWYTTGGNPRTPQHYTWESFLLWLVTGIPAENFTDMVPASTGDVPTRTEPNVSTVERSAPLTDALQRAIELRREVRGAAWPAAGAANIDDADDNVPTHGDKGE